MNPVENQLVFENTHPAIIDEDIWEIVSKKRQHKRYIPRYEVSGLFAGTVYCSDCGEKLYYTTRKLKTQSGERLEGAYSCSVYRKQTIFRDRKCTAHYISETALTELVTDELRELLSYVTKYEKRFVKIVADKNAAEQTKSLSVKKAAAEKSHARIEELDLLIEKLYEDNATGKVSDERYAKLSAKFETEQAGLQTKFAALEAEILNLESKAVNVEKFLALVRKYTQIEELTPAIVSEFIDKIIVHEPEQARGNRKQKVEIIWCKIGAINLPCENTNVAELSLSKAG